MSLRVTRRGRHRLVCSCRRERGEEGAQLGPLLERFRHPTTGETVPEIEDAGAHPPGRRHLLAHRRPPMVAARVPLTYSSAGVFTELRAASAGATGARCKG